VGLSSSPPLIPRLRRRHIPEGARCRGRIARKIRPPRKPPRSVHFVCMAMSTESARTMLPVHQAGQCSVAAASEIVGAKWTVLIVHDLSEGPRRFTELEHACERISPRTLAERLRWLEAEGIVVRRSYAESPPRVEYELTDKGQALQPIIDEMRRFGHEWLGCEVHPADAA